MLTPIEKLAADRPYARVRLHFCDAQGNRGTLETIARHAAYPNQSQRFFPPGNETPRSLGWPVPYWYASECERVTVLD